MGLKVSHSFMGGVASQLKYCCTFVLVTIISLQEQVQLIVQPICSLSLARQPINCVLVNCNISTVYLDFKYQLLSTIIPQEKILRPHVPIWAYKLTQRFLSKKGGTFASTYILILISCARLRMTRNSAGVWPVGRSQSW